MNAIRVWCRQSAGAMLALVLTASSAPTQDAPASLSTRVQPFPDTWQSALDTFTKVKDGAQTTPGLLMIVESPDWGARVGASGYADIAKKTAPDHSMHFRIGSLSKVFTALTVLSLEQDGLLRLDDTLDKYLTGPYALDPRYHPEKITIRNCLQHTAGLGNYLSTKYFNKIPYEEPQLHVSPERLITQINAELDEVHSGKPIYDVGTAYNNPFGIFLTVKGWSGQKPKPVVPRDILDPIFPNPSKDDIIFDSYDWWFYSNNGYICLGIVIEKVSKKKLDQAIKERVVDKLGLKNTYFATDDKLPEPRFLGYSKLDAKMNPIPNQKDWVEHTDFDPSYAWAAGAVVSTPADILEVLRGAFTTEKILNKATKAKWFTFVTADLIWANMDYGVGALMQNQQPFGMLRGHGGSIPCFNNLAYYLPDSDTFMVIVLNTWDKHSEVDVMKAVMPLVAASVTTPQPADSAKIPAAQTVTLKWQPGRTYGDSYAVYLGTNREQVGLAGTDQIKGKFDDIQPSKVTLPVLSKNGLVRGGRYYWRVDALSAKQGTVRGPVWSFQVN